MQVIIKSRQTQISQRLREKIEHKAQQRLARLVAEEARIEVTVAEEQTRSANDRFTVQLTLLGNAQPIHSEVSALTASAALDLVVDKVIAQLGRQKDRQKSTRRNQTPGIKVLSLSRTGVLASSEEEEMAFFETDGVVDEENNEEIWSQIMEIRRLPARAMSDQEVIAQMEKDGVAFYPFFNGETNSVNVMYKLAQGGYGLLVPAVS